MKMKIVKRTKLFEEFVNEAATAEVVSTETVKLKKTLEKEIEEANTLVDEVENLKKQMKAVQNILDPKIQKIVTEMEKVGATSITLKKDLKTIQVKMVTVKGRVTYSYQKVVDKIRAINKKMASLVDGFLELFKNVNPDKKNLEFSVQEGVMDNISKWVSGVLGKLTKLTKEFFGAADDIHKLAVDLK